MTFDILMDHFLGKPINGMTFKTKCHREYNIWRIRHLANTTLSCATNRVISKRDPTIPDISTPFQQMPYKIQISPIETCFGI